MTNTYISEHDLACAKQLSIDFRKIYNFHNFAVIKLEEKRKSGIYLSPAENDKYDHHRECVRSLSRIVAMAEAAIYKDNLDYHKIMTAFVK